MAEKENGATDKGTATNRNGLGSTYAGTETPNPNDPDGYQKPAAGAKAATNNTDTQGGLGDEYADDSSYGDKDNATLTKGSPDGTGKQASGEEEGSPIR